jgi:hypothetical protein
MDEILPASHSWVSGGFETPDSPPPPAPGTAPSSGVCSIGADYLLLWTRQAHVPPLVTAGSINDTVPGAIGQPGTIPLLAGPFDERAHSGIRFTVVVPVEEGGIESRSFFVPLAGSQFSVSSTGADGTPVLARPFFNINANAPDADPFAIPNVLAGTLTATSLNRFYGTELNLTDSFFHDKELQAQMLVGLRYMGLDDRLSIASVGIGLPQGSGFSTYVADKFYTQNFFYGGQLGASSEFALGSLRLGLRGTLALGETHQIATISGATAVTSGGQTTFLTGGLLALPSNIGHYHRDEFAAVPEVGITVGYQCTSCLRLTGGYTFLYWSDVARASDQIDPRINVTQLTGQQLTGLALPTFGFRGTGYWAQGIQLGLEFRF